VHDALEVRDAASPGLGRQAAHQRNGSRGPSRRESYGKDPAQKRKAVRPAQENAPQCVGTRQRGSKCCSRHAGTKPHQRSAREDASSLLPDNESFLDLGTDPL
jgi:hypothetical protein